MVLLRIKELRDDRRLTQEELALLLRWDRSKVSRLESGTRKPNGQDLDDLARVFKVEIADLFGAPERSRQ